MVSGCKEMTCFSWLYSKSQINKATLRSISILCLVISLSSVKIQKKKVKIEVGGSR